MSSDTVADCAAIVIAGVLQYKALDVSLSVTATINAAGGQQFWDAALIFYKDLAPPWVGMQH